MLLEAMIGVNFGESRIFTKCNGTKVQSKTLEFIEGRWKVNVSLRDINTNYRTDLSVRTYKIRLFNADGDTYLGIKEDGKSVEIVVPVGAFNLDIANDICLQFDVEKLEDDCDDDYDDSDDYDDEEYDCEDSDYEDEDDDSDWCDEDEDDD